MVPPSCTLSHECHAEVLTQAVQKDLGKALPFEVTASEINLGTTVSLASCRFGRCSLSVVLTEIEENLKHLDIWAAPTPVYTNSTESAPVALSSESRTSR